MNQFDRSALLNRAWASLSGPDGDFGSQNDCKTKLQTSNFWKRSYINFLDSVINEGMLHMETAHSRDASEGGRVILREAVKLGSEFRFPHLVEPP